MVTEHCWEIQVVLRTVVVTNELTMNCVGAH